MSMQNPVFIPGPTNACVPAIPSTACGNSTNQAFEVLFGCVVGIAVGWCLSKLWPLREEPPADRKIISITGGSPKKTLPPFYQIKTVQATICQKWYALNVQDNVWKTGLVKGHTAPCAEDTLPPDAEIRTAILEYLEEHGYDTSSFPPFQ